MVGNSGAHFHRSPTLNYHVLRHQTWCSNRHFNKPEHDKTNRRAVAEQRSSPELYLAKTKPKCIWSKKKMNSKLLEYEDVLYFDLQSHPMACTLGSVVMEWKQTLQGSYKLFERAMLSDNWLMWYRHFINHEKSVTLTSRSVRKWGWGWNSVKFQSLWLWP